MKWTLHGSEAPQTSVWLREWNWFPGVELSRHGKNYALWCDVCKQSHISLESKKKWFEKTVDCAPEIGLVLDEATSLSRKSDSIRFLMSGMESAFIRFQMSGMESPENTSVELVELEDVSSHGTVALDAVNLASNTNRTLVRWCRKSGVAARLKSLFPNMKVWHCSAHRLEPAVGDNMKESGAINHFRISRDKRYALYSTSNKNGTELKRCADRLDIQLCKTGQQMGCVEFQIRQSCMEKLSCRLQLFQSGSRRFFPWQWYPRELQRPS